MFFNEITLKKDSWHWKFQSLVLQDFAWKSFPINFCPYYWTVVACFILWPFTIVALFGTIILTSFYTVVDAIHRITKGIEKNKLQRARRSILFVVALIDYWDFYQKGTTSKILNESLGEGAYNDLIALRDADKHNYLKALVRKNGKILYNINVRQVEALKSFSTYSDTIFKLRLLVENNNKRIAQKNIVQKRREEQIDKIVSTTSTFVQRATNTLSPLAFIIKFAKTIMPFAGLTIVAAILFGAGWIIWTESTLLGWYNFVKIAFSVIILILGFLIAYFTIGAFVVFFKNLFWRIKYPRLIPPVFKTIWFNIVRFFTYVIYWTKLIVSIFFAWKQENCPSIKWEE